MVFGFVSAIFLLTGLAGKVGPTTEKRDLENLFEAHQVVAFVSQSQEALVRCLFALDHVEAAAAIGPESAVDTAFTSVPWLSSEPSSQIMMPPSPLVMA